MKKREDLERAFGRADAEFERTIIDTLDALEAREKEKHMKRKLGFTVAIALAAMLVLTAIGYAAASSGGLLERLSSSFWNHPQVLPKATAIVQSNLEQEGGETSDAVFRVREAVFDGCHIFMTVAIQPKDAHTLLLGVDSAPYMPVSDFRADWIAEDHQRIGAWAEENGYTELLNTNIGADFIDSKDYQLEPDGTLVYLIIGSLGNDLTEGYPKTLDVTLRCQTMPYMERELVPDRDALKEAELRFTLAASGYFAGAEYTAPFDIPEVGVRMESVKLTATALSVYAEVTYTVTDVDKYLDDEGYSGLWFRIVDADGNELPNGVYGGGSIEWVDREQASAKEFKTENGDRFVQRWDLEAMESLPDTIRLQAYDCWEKGVYGTWEIDFTE